MISMIPLSQERLTAQTATEEAERTAGREAQSKRAAATVHRRASELIQALRTLVSELSRCTQGIKSRRGTANSSRGASEVGPNAGVGTQQQLSRSGSEVGAGGSSGGQLFAAEIASMTDTLSLGETQDLLMGGGVGEGGATGLSGDVGRGSSGGYPHDHVHKGPERTSGGSLERRADPILTRLSEAVGVVEEEGGGRAGARPWERDLLESLVQLVIREVEGTL